MLDLKTACPHKVVDAEAAIDTISNGSRVFIGSGCGEPRHLVRETIKQQRLQDIMMYQMFSFTLADYMEDQDFLRRFSLKLFFISASMRKAAFEGKIDYVPVYLSEIPKLFNDRMIGIDTALVQISPPDRFGFGSLGVSVDVTRSAVKNAKTVIAQVNPRMPRTWGDGFIHVDEIDYLVEYEEDLVESVPSLPDAAVARQISRYVADLVDDGATLQIGFGRLPYAVLSHLDEKRDLGVHTQMITDAFLPLFHNGVITNRKKNYLPDRAVATICMGSREIYDFIDENPMIYFRAADFVNDPLVVARNDNFISISSALEVDLTGQVCSDSVDNFFYSGTGDQANFIRGAAMSRGGFSVVALPSTAKDGAVSRIVAVLSEGAGVGALRADVDFIVTEYGIAQLRGKSIYQRVVELAQIAHPDFREILITEAKNQHYVVSDQMPPPPEDLRFIENYKRRFILESGKTLAVRPLLPSDEIAYRNFFYSLTGETVYHRFFKKIRVFSHQMAQEHWVNLDYRKNLTLIGLMRVKERKEIVAIASYAQETEETAEVAFVVREDHQGEGISTSLLAILEDIARQNGYRYFSAFVMPGNRAMRRVFTKRYPNAEQSMEDGYVAYRMDFDDPDKPAETGDENGT
jgi:acyl-CoA hydrolase